MHKRVWRAGVVTAFGTLGWMVPGWSDVAADAGISIAIGSLTTTEAGGSAAFSVVLAQAPTDAVSLSFSSSDTTEGTVSPASVTFTVADWDQPQTVTVTGVDDDIDDGDVSYLVISGAAVSTDPAYAGLDPADLTFTNIDDEDTPGFSVVAATPLTVLESGTTATYTLALTSQPTSDVVVSHTSSDTTEGTVSPATSTFTPADWDQPQTITVKGVNDLVDDGDVDFRIDQAVIAPTADPVYTALSVPAVPVVTLDDELPAVLLVPVGAATTTEAGGTATYQVQLSSRPSTTVAVQLATTDATEGAPTVAEVRFSRTNWNVAQTITIQGVNDAIDDGDVAYRIQHTVVTTDQRYRSVVVDDVTFTNIDDDAAGVRFLPSSGLRAPEGSSIQFTAVLLSEPTAPVTVTNASSDPSQGRVAPGATTFDATNWNVPQPVTITGISDGLADGEAVFFIEHLVISDDPVYAALTIPRQRVRSADDGIGATTTSTVAPSTSTTEPATTTTEPAATTTAAAEVTTSTEVASEPATSTSLITRANNHLPTTGVAVERPIAAAAAATIGGIVVQLVSRRRTGRARRT